MMKTFIFPAEKKIYKLWNELFTLNITRCTCDFNICLLFPAADGVLKGDDDVKLHKSGIGFKTLR